MEILTESQKSLALRWYTNEGYGLSTIAQHFGMSRDQLASQLNTTVMTREHLRCL